MMFLLWGCVQTSLNKPISTIKDSETADQGSASVDSAKQAHTISNTDPLLPAKPAVQENTISDATKKDQTKTAEKNKIESNPGKTVQATLDDALEFCQVSQDYWQKGELEKALEALDQAYYLILNVDTYDDPKLIQQKEDLRFMISKRITEIYASRHIVVNGNHKAIPIEINRHIQSEINLFTTGKEKTFFIQSYKRSGRYRDRILEALQEAGLPNELSWLPLIESGFKVNALSRARALGLWQFIPSTGYKFGLKRNLYVDERLDPEKATLAAIAYLKELHAIFGDWATCLAAYNCGEGKVLRVIRNQNVNYLDNFWDLYQRLPRETARYVPRFLATIHIINHLKDYGLDQITLDPPIEYETVTIERHAHLKDIAKSIGISQKTLKELNPELRYNLLPKEKYPLNVPAGKGKMLLANVGKIPLSYPPQSSYVYHRIRPGETLSTIARRYRTSMRSIALANNLTKKHYIVAGKRLKIPQKGTNIYPVNNTRASSPKTVTSHVVKSGDSLWILAKRYDTTVKKIQELNNLRSTALHINQVLKIPAGAVKKSKGGKSQTYQVRHGDSPYKIANKHNIPLRRLLKINNLTSKSRIYPGQTLLIE
jgi:peptidoglycan lytic transglycosylase D